MLRLRDVSSYMHLFKQLFSFIVPYLSTIIDYVRGSKLHKSDSSQEEKRFGSVGT